MVVCGGGLFSKAPTPWLKRGVVEGDEAGSAFVTGIRRIRE